MAVRAKATTGFNCGKAAINGRRVNPVARRDEIDVVGDGLAIVGGDEHVLFRAANPAPDQRRRRDLIEVALH